MTYSEVVKNNLILSKKSSYTKNDFDKLISSGEAPKRARFICICSAVYHDVKCSNFFHSRKLRLECGIL